MKLLIPILNKVLLLIVLAVSYFCIPKLLEQNKDFSLKNLSFPYNITHTFEKENNTKILITDHFRTPRSQARLMIGSARYYFQDLRTLYRDQSLVGPIADCIDRGCTEDEVTAIIEAQMADGKFISKHLCGKAVDIRTYLMEDGELDKLIELVKKKGYKYIVKTSPPHIHIEDKGSCH